MLSSKNRTKCTFEFLCWNPWKTKWKCVSLYQLSTNKSDWHIYLDFFPSHREVNDYRIQLKKKNHLISNGIIFQSAFTVYFKRFCFKAYPGSLWLDYCNDRGLKNIQQNHSVTVWPRQWSCSNIFTVVWFAKSNKEHLIITCVTLYNFLPLAMQSSIFENRTP